MNPENAEWLDGPGLCAWLNEHVHEFAPHTELPPSLVRRYTDAMHGSHVSVWNADRMLTILGHSLTELPAEIFRPDPRGKPYRELRAEAVRRVRQNGEGPCAVARSLTVDRSTVGRWLREAS